MDTLDAFTEQKDENRGRYFKGKEGPRPEIYSHCPRFGRPRFRNISPHSSTFELHKENMARSDKYTDHVVQYHQIAISPRIAHQNLNRVHDHNVLLERQYKEDNKGYINHPTTSQGNNNVHLHSHVLQRNNQEHTNRHLLNYREKAWYYGQNRRCGRGYDRPYHLPVGHFYPPPVHSDLDPHYYSPPGNPTSVQHPPEEQREKSLGPFLQPETPVISTQTEAHPFHHHLSSGPEKSSRNGGLKSLDVVCGRGAPKNFHYGNHAFSEFIKGYQTSYMCSKRGDKPRIALQLLDTMKSQGIRFVKRQKSSGAHSCWVEIDSKRAYEKVCQALRDGAPDARREMLSTSIMGKYEKENRSLHF